MELRTRLVPVGSRMSVDGEPADAWCDAMAAHALVRAMGEWQSPTYCTNEMLWFGCIQWVEKRAAELMREWGLTEGDL